MVWMTSGEIVLMAFVAFVSAGMGTLFWRQVEGLRVELVALRDELRGGMTGLRTELRGEITELRREMRAEFASLRSDLTQVALAVGVGRPRASDA
jgi:hypothetical protein